MEREAMLHKAAPEGVLNQLRIWTAEGHRILIGGDPGGGKTTLLVALAAAVPDRERIIKIEDAEEIWLARPHVQSLKALPTDEFSGLLRLDSHGTLVRTGFSMADAVDDAMRMAGDRLVVGEIRDGKAALALMISGHATMATLRAGSPGDACDRLDAMLRADTGTTLDMVFQLLHEEGPYLYVQMVRARDGDTTRHAILGVYELTRLAPAAGDRPAHNGNSDFGFRRLWAIGKPDMRVLALEARTPVV